MKTLGRELMEFIEEQKLLHYGAWTKEAEGILNEFLNMPLKRATKEKSEGLKGQYFKCGTCDYRGENFEAHPGNVDIVVCPECVSAYVLIDYKENAQ